MSDILNSNHQLNTAQTNATTTIIQETIQEVNQPSSSATVNLNLKKRKDRKKVGWAQDTVDNENLNRKKSKCCCIYEAKKEVKYGDDGNKSDSDSESSDCCGKESENCYGHNKPMKNESDDKSN